MLDTQSANVQQNLSSLYAKKRFIKEYCIAEKFKEGRRLGKFQADKISSLEIFLASLEKDMQKIFIENFIFTNPDSEWYLDYWSKGTYYKRLNEVVNLFLGYIHDRY
ncbi:MG284/MPN403 family protein [Metamycoplasma hyosynoviae]|uniref:MG284/MPN403 family protein n=1 Tax=Metamycoplasma hyosynoviae TaxID=29559 RepID=UPI002359A2B4|nr:hypothetical protein [Metamycoplasma hyosynoviae]MDC8915629.1 hypothetical protein [Metamycoplasma hyosynoviae]MDC8919531.1 hypothetical protein [Metamycoplasma hyosynoviae]MDC8937014.1 hypothetical protein [Metamycoplasma hyosynoviae]MDD1372411.1 hypothetical protein [Metamycoplasma hyosynoviae]